MILKKVNACCSWLLTLSLLGHLGTMSYSMMTGWYNYTVCKTLAHFTAGFAILHIAVSLIIMFFLNDGAVLSKYPKMNIETILQRVTGLVIIALLHLHVQAFGFIVTGEALSNGIKAETMITEILFFGAIFTHLSVSIPRSLMTFGMIRTEAAEQRTRRASRVICLLLFLLTCWALSGFVITWSGYQG